MAPEYLDFQLVNQSAKWTDEDSMITRNLITYGLLSCCILALGRSIAQAQPATKWDAIIGEEMCRWPQYYINRNWQTQSSSLFSKENLLDKIRFRKDEIQKLEGKYLVEMSDSIPTDSITLTDIRLILVYDALTQNKVELVKNSKTLATWCKNQKWKNDYACVGIAEINENVDEYIQAVNYQASYMASEGIGTKWYLGIEDEMYRQRAKQIKRVSPRLNPRLKPSDSDNNQAAEKDRENLALCISRVPIRPQAPDHILTEDPKAAK